MNKNVFGKFAEILYKGKPADKHLRKEIEAIFMKKNHEPRDTRISGNLKERRIRQFEEAKTNGGQPNTVNFSQNKESLTKLQIRSFANEI